MSAAVEAQRAKARAELQNLGVASVASLARSNGYVAVRADEQRAVLPLGDGAFFVHNDAGSVALELPGARALCVGKATPPSLAGQPPPRYGAVIAVLEYTLRRYFEFTRSPETDEELLRILQQLARRPDGSDLHRVHGYLRAAARACLCLEDFSEAELEAVFRRMSHSAKTFRLHTTSRNYWENVLSTATVGSYL